MRKIKRKQRFKRRAPHVRPTSGMEALIGAKVLEALRGGADAVTIRKGAPPGPQGAPTPKPSAAPLASGLSAQELNGKFASSPMPAEKSKKEPRLSTGEGREPPKPAATAGQGIKLPGLGGIGLLLEQREATHGGFWAVADLAQNLKRKLAIHSCVPELPSIVQEMAQEALDSICTKLARIAHGDANHVDHWRDIAGYALLVAESLDKK